MSIEFEIKTAFLKALSNLSAKKDLRTYLQGVAIICKDNELSLVASDGDVFGRLYKNITLPDFSLIIEGKDVVKLCTLYKTSTLSFSFDKTSYDDRVIDYSVNNTMFTACDSKFPDFYRLLWSNTIPDGKANNYDLELLSKFVKVSKDLGCKKYTGVWGMEHSSEKENARMLLPKDTDIGEWCFDGLIARARY